MNTGLFDKNGTPINVGDKTRLILKDGEIREFDVCFKTVQRTTIKTLRGFNSLRSHRSPASLMACMSFSVSVFSLSSIVMISRKAQISLW